MFIGDINWSSSHFFSFLTGWSIGHTKFPRLFVLAYFVVGLLKLSCLSLVLLVGVVWILFSLSSCLFFPIHRIIYGAFSWGVCLCSRFHWLWLFNMTDLCVGVVSISVRDSLWAPFQGAPFFSSHVPVVQALICKTELWLQPWTFWALFLFLV